MPYSGSYVAIITPFTDTLDVDEKALRNLVSWHIENKTDGLVCVGTTGEGINLSFQERLQVMRICVDEAKGRIPIVAGTTTASTMDSVYLTLEAKKVGIDAALAIVPYYNRPTDEGCFLHFLEIAQVGLDMIVYENPARTAKSLLPATFKRLESIPQIKAIKASCGTVENFIKLKQATSLPLFAGDDPITLDSLKEGAVGSVSVIGNLIPKQWSEMIHKCIENELGNGLLIFQKYKKLVETLGLETNPQMVKYGVYLLNKCKLFYRLPLIEPSIEHQKSLDNVLFELGLIEKSVF